MLVPDLNRISYDILMSCVPFVVFVSTTYFLFRQYSGHRNLGHIPTIGSSLPLFSYLGCIKFVYDATGMLQEGYERFRPGVFKVASLYQWLVVVCGAKYIEEFRKASDDVLSFDDAAHELIQTSYTLGKGVMSDPYHIPILSAQFTRNLHAMFPDLHDETVSSLRDVIPPSAANGWVSIPALDVMTQVVTRVCNRAFVGLPLCREPEYVNLCMRFAVKEVIQAAIVIGTFPKLLRPLVSCFLTRPSTRINRAMMFLAPITADRKERIDNDGKDYPHKPNDFLQWLLMDPRGSHASAADIAARILAINVASVRTPSMAITHALFHLLARPEYIQPLRQEIESIVKAEGWTKTAVDKMYKLDSFLKESLRFGGDTRFVTMMRKSRKPFAFSNGIVIPQGTMMVAASYPTHFDPSLYPNAHEFDGFRFDKLRRESVIDKNDSGLRHQLTTTSTDFLAWGYGRHACPGRFFSGLKMKLILSYLILNYDLQLEQPGVRPADFVLEANRMPNAQANILIKYRG